MSRTRYAYTVWLIVGDHGLSETHFGSDFVQHSGRHDIAISTAIQCQRRGKGAGGSFQGGKPHK
ncbi:hypothetical protein [Nostoc sp.]|uniref:hypothetical protein n=1 Tax=Nostoc sp. TaxID=1180 RepID=UPI002FFC7ACE